MESKLKQLTPVLLVAGVLLAGGVFWLFSSSEVLFTARPDSSLKHNPDYPPFKSGILNIHVEGKEHKIALTENIETAYKGLPGSVIGSTVVATLESPYWKLKSNTITLEKTTMLDLLPNGNLATLTGNVVDEHGSPVSNAFIQVGNDTVLYSDYRGSFKAGLSFPLQKENQHLTISKNGYVSQELNHRPGNNLVIRMRHSYGGRQIIRRNKETIGDYVIKRAIDEGIRRHW